MFLTLFNCYSETVEIQKVSTPNNILDRPIGDHTIGSWWVIRAGASTPAGLAYERGWKSPLEGVDVGLWNSGFVLWFGMKFLHLRNYSIMRVSFLSLLVNYWDFLMEILIFGYEIVCIYRICKKFLLVLLITGWVLQPTRRPVLTKKTN